MSYETNERWRTDEGYNLHIVNIDDCGSSGVPELEVQRNNPNKLIGFHYALSIKESEKKDAFCHFFIDDYRFERVWRSPERYLNVLKKFAGALTPDFSLYTDMPMPMQRWNVYRSRAIGYYWQLSGVNVIPTVEWSTHESYEFCFKGIPQNSTIAVSTVGVMKRKETRELWCDGMTEAIKQLNPSLVVVYGKLPVFDFGKITVKRFESTQRERMDKWEAEEANRLQQKHQ